MAAYAAVVSVMQIIHQIETHPFPPISLDKQQVDSLTEKVNLLQEFLEGYDSPFGYSDEADPLEMRIADAAYAAEDVIESYIVDNIKFVAKTTHHDADDEDNGDDDDDADAATDDAEDEDNGDDDADAATDDADDNDDGDDDDDADDDADAATDDDNGDDDADAATDDAEFLEGYNSPFDYSYEADPLEMRIAHAAYAAEDVIESYIVDNIKLQVAEISCITFYEDMQKVIEEMDLLVREVTQMVGEKPAVQRSVGSRDAAAAFGSISGERKSEMVGFDDMLLELLDRLTGGRSNRQIIPIVGMGGVGKTTLALNVFQNQLIKERFDICVWATISQNYDIQQTLAQVLSQVRGNTVDKSDPNLGEELYKFFCGRKYLIVMDDMWSLEVWDKMKFFFPEYNNGSRVLVTTRLSNMATQLTDSDSLLYVKCLDEISSWGLFSKTVFGEDSFPPELEEIGKKIVEKCSGHPLAIVVIGGLLAKSECTKEQWEEIEENLISIVNSENDEYCLRILRLSYNHLPMCLKPCFLYMGVFGEDSEINVSTLIKLWVSEGFVKPKNNKSLETIAEEYLKELVDRNLVLVYELGSIGGIKSCIMHDLVRDVCLKEAKKQRFYYDISDLQDIPLGMDNQRRIVIRNGSSSAELIDDVLESISHVRSILCEGYSSKLNLFRDFRLLRILSMDRSCAYRIEDVFQYVNLRYINNRIFDSKIPCSINLLWNLHTFTTSVLAFSVAPIEIWKMHQLRHLWRDSSLYLPDPPRGDNDIVIMENLQSLKGVTNLNLNEEVVKRIPNIKKLFVVYKGERIQIPKCLSYLEFLSELESLNCSVLDGGEELWQKISFPKSLKKLRLAIYSPCCEWEDILPKIGALPLLQKLRLSFGVFGTRKWETIQGQFPSLKVLFLNWCRDLESWMVSDSSHFPSLQKLRLSLLEDLEVIPSEIGEIPTLKSIEICRCSDSVVVSAKKIVEEQEELHGDQPDLHVTVTCKDRDQANALQHLAATASPNFTFFEF